MPGYRESHVSSPLENVSANFVTAEFWRSIARNLWRRSMAKVVLRVINDVCSWRVCSLVVVVLRLTRYLPENFLMQ